MLLYNSKQVLSAQGLFFFNMFLSHAFKTAHIERLRIKCSSKQKKRSTTPLTSRGSPSTTHREGKQRPPASTDRGFSGTDAPRLLPWNPQQQVHHTLAREESHPQFAGSTSPPITRVTNLTPALKAGI